MIAILYRILHSIASIALYPSSLYLPRVCPLMICMLLSVLVVIAVVGWVIFVVMVGLLIYYRRYVLLTLHTYANCYFPWHSQHTYIQTATFPLHSLYTWLSTSTFPLHSLHTYMPSGTFPLHSLSRVY